MIICIVYIYILRSVIELAGEPSPTHFNVLSTILQLTRAIYILFF